MELRPYQIEAIEILRAGFLKHQRQILCLPTGAGKTVVFSEMIRMAVEKGTKTLVVTDRIELCTQTLRAISKHQIPTQILDASTKGFYPDAPVTLSMVETLARRMKKWPAGYYTPVLIVIDESHKNTFSKIMDAFPDAKVIGATATPKAKFLHKYYTNIVENIDIPELVASGFLSRCRPFKMKDGADMTEVKITKGDFNEKQMYSSFDKPKLYDGVIEKYMETTPNSKALVFNVSVEHAQKMTAAFNSAGIHSECVTGKTPPAERKRILDAFSKGLFPVLNNCSVLTTGYDEPSIETIIVNRATISEPLWLQMCGRGSRIFNGKPYFSVLDFGGNHERLGMWEEEREWSLDPPTKKKKGIAATKTCPKCSAMLHARVMVCEFCGHIFAEKERELIAGGELVEILRENKEHEFSGRKLSSLSIEELVALTKLKKIKTKQIWRAVRHRGIPAIREYGFKVGYKEGWADHQAVEMESDPQNLRDRTL